MTHHSFQMQMVQVTIWLALVGYMSAVVVTLTAPSARPLQAIARLLWTLGCVSFLLHVGTAFHYYYQWSHATAWQATARDTRALTGFSSGFGLYLNYLFTGLWILDAASWWKLGLDGYRQRPRWIGGAVQLFFFFMVFNAVVVFEEGTSRWLGLATCLILFGLWIHRRQQGSHFG